MQANNIFNIGKQIALFVASVTLQQVTEQAQLIKDVFAGIAQFLIAFFTLLQIIKFLKVKKDEKKVG